MIELYLDDLLGFFEKGGFVLYVVFGIAFFLWTFLVERYIYINFTFRKEKRNLLADIKDINPNNKFKDEIRKYLLANSSVKLSSGLEIIKTLIIVCPLVGLLGTVTGMIEVFDVMAITGTSNVKSMANGVSMATIPTMAGMVVALSGILVEKRLEHTIKYKKQKLELEISKAI